jgi:hypothetical protein
MQSIDIKALFPNDGSVVMTMTMKSTIFMDVTPCSLLKSTDVSMERTVSTFEVEE